MAETIREHLQERLAEVRRLPPDQRVQALRELLRELRQLEAREMQDVDELEQAIILELDHAEREYRHMVELSRR